MTGKWFHFDKFSIRVTLDGKPFKLGFFEPEPAKKAEKGEQVIKNKHRIAPSRSPNDPEFMSSDYWERKLISTVYESPETDFSKEDVEEAIKSFLMVAEDALPPMLEDLEKGEATETEESEDELNGEIEKEIEERSEEILESERPLEELNRELGNIVAGEEKNRVFLFTILLSGKVDDPSKKQMVLIKGGAGGGKSTMMKIADAFKVKDVGRFTPHALDYSDLEGYDVLRLKEVGKMDQEDQGISTLKFLSADDEGYKVEYTVRDEETGKFETEEKRIPPITVISSTTRIEVEEQFERRAWFVSPDESEEQTKRISEWQAEREEDEMLVDLGAKEITDYERSKKVLEKVVDKINPHNVRVPFQKSLHSVLGNEQLRVRGDFKKITSFVELYTLINSYREGNGRPKIEGTNGNSIIFSIPEDGKKAVEYASDPLRTMLSGMDERIENLLGAMKEEGLGKKGTKVEKEDRVKLARELNISERVVRRSMNRLEKLGYCVSSGGKGSNPKSHTLQVNVGDILAGSLDITGQGELPGKYLEYFGKEGISTIQSLLDKAFEGVEPPTPHLEPYFKHIPDGRKGSSTPSEESVQQNSDAVEVSIFESEKAEPSAEPLSNNDQRNEEKKGGEPRTESVAIELDTLEEEPKIDKDAVKDEIYRQMAHDQGARSAKNASDEFDISQDLAEEILEKLYDEDKVRKKESGGKWYYHAS